MPTTIRHTMVKMDVAFLKVSIAAATAASVNPPIRTTASSCTCPALKLEKLATNQTRPHSEIPLGFQVQHFHSRKKNPRRVSEHKK